MNVIELETLMNLRDFLRDHANTLGERLSDADSASDFEQWAEAIRKLIVDNYTKARVRAGEGNR